MLCKTLSAAVCRLAGGGGGTTASEAGGRCTSASEAGAAAGRILAKLPFGTSGDGRSDAYLYETITKT